MAATIISNPHQLRDPGQEGALDAQGRLQILSADWWQQFSKEEIAMFCHLNAYYAIPTKELIDWLAPRLRGRTAIEIGAGAGVLAAALGIPATDNRMQEWPAIAAHYKRLRQPTITYGTQVEALDAKRAVAKYKPDVVIASWVTHRWLPQESWREGNAEGVEERDIIKHAEYILIGHSHVHRLKPILEQPHDTYTPSWLVSRALSEGTNFIKIWPAA